MEGGAGDQAVILKKINEALRFGDPKSKAGAVSKVLMSVAAVPGEKETALNLDFQAALIFAMEATFSAWGKLYMTYDLGDFVALMQSATGLDTLEEELAQTTRGPERELYRDWLTPFRRFPNPADPLSGQVNTMKIQASFGAYWEQMKALARSGSAQAATTIETKAPQSSATPQNESKGKHRWFDKSTARGRKDRYILAAILAALALVWVHKHWSNLAVDEQTFNSAPARYTMLSGVLTLRNEG